MPDPCRQEDRLNHFESDLTDMIRGIRSGQKEQTELMKELISQNGRINLLEKDNARFELSINEAFKRIRSLELLPGKAASKWFWMTVTAVSGCIGGIMSGLLIWLITRGP